MARLWGPDWRRWVRCVRPAPSQGLGAGGWAALLWWCGCPLGRGVRARVAPSAPVSGCRVARWPLVDRFGGGRALGADGCLIAAWSTRWSAGGHGLEEPDFRIPGVPIGERSRPERPVCG